MVDQRVIRQTALRLVLEDGAAVGPRLAASCGISRQVASNHLRALTKQGLIEANGSTRSKVYRLKTVAEATREFPCAGLAEDRVWREVFAPPLAGLPENVLDIWEYGVTEMVNNAIDHSGSASVQVGVRRNALYTDGWIADEGDGIFIKIQRAMNFYDPREAILELAKGKLTTDPEHHSGEGIFFTSKLFDSFLISSGQLHFVHAGRDFEVVLERPADAPGTLVVMRLANDSSRTKREVFNEFAEPDDFTFDKTLVPVRLAQYEGEKLVSRSQAKRLYQRFERFRHVILDFEGVAEIGQAFADEVFRVFKASHPSVVLTPINITPEVSRMIGRVETRVT